MAAEVLVIWGEALYLSSLGVLLYSVVISLGAHAAVRYVEGPELRKRSGCPSRSSNCVEPLWGLVPAVLGSVVLAAQRTRGVYTRAGA